MRRRVVGGPGSDPESVRPGGAVSVTRVLPLYLVVFVGFAGYSLMIAIFTPLLLRLTAPSSPVVRAPARGRSPWACCSACTP